MLTQNNIAFLDSVLVRIISEADGPMFEREVFHAFLNLTGPMSPLKDELIAQNMLIMDVITTYSVADRLVGLALKRKIMCTVLAMPNGGIFSLYFPIGSTVTNV